MTERSSPRQEKDTFHFFDSLIRRGKLSRLKKDFVSRQGESSSHNYTFNPESNSLEGIEYDREADEWEAFSLPFDEYLAQRLRPEFDRVVAHLDQDFRSKASEEGAELLKRYYLGQLGRLKGKLSRYKEEEGRKVVELWLGRLEEEVRVRADAFSMEDSSADQQSAPSEIPSGESGGDGRHKYTSKKEWIKSVWQRVREDHPQLSQYRRIQKVQTAFEDEFEEESPSESTIRRYVGLRE